jgi:putative spermidine/putrescine transport system substrate-binding protein
VLKVPQEQLFHRLGKQQAAKPPGGEIMAQDTIHRRTFLAGVAGMAAAPGAFAQTLKLPASPLTISVIDVGGALALVQTPLENYPKANPKAVSRMVFTKAPAPELPAKLKAQQDAGRLDIDFVIGGLDVLSAGIDQKLWVELLPRFAADLPKPDDIYLKQARSPCTISVERPGHGDGLFAVRPAARIHARQGQDGAEDGRGVLAYVKQNKNRFTYARPLNSGPGRTFMQGMPYILGDSDPKDPMPTAGTRPGPISRSSVRERSSTIRPAPPRR